MHTYSKAQLTRATMLFPLALVLFEFSVYICNDLVQPAMLVITQEFGASSNWVPSSMSFFLLGGACLAWFLGPLSDRIGRKKVLLAGVLFFVICCLVILLSQNIEQFLALRFLQGIGLTMISAVGYAAIQEYFEERSAIKVMALMANISLIAPLLGPVLGAFMIEHVSWHWGFIGIAIIALISWFGLKATMPELKSEEPQQPIQNIGHDFKNILLNKRFMILAFSLPLVSIPLILWIALSPVILVEQLGLTNMQYGFAQVPVLGGLIIGNIVLIRVLDRMPVGQTVMLTLPIMLIGALIIFAGTIWPEYLLWNLIIGMTLMSFGEGCSFSVLYRFSLDASDVSKGTVAAVVAMILMIAFFIVIEIVRIGYAEYGMWAYSIACLVLILVWFTWPRIVVKDIMHTRAVEQQA